ncbi:MAG: radical SAM protein [candidate division WOR-3 bacterium]
MIIKGLKSKELYFNILRDTLKENIPLHCYLEITNKCNARCYFCFQGEEYRKREDLDTETWKKIIIELEKMGCFWVIISGGEPLIREDFWDIIEFLKKKRFVLSLVSNGILLKKEDIIRFKKYYFESITVSIHSVNKETCDKIFGINYPLDKIINIILEMNKENLPIVVHAVLTKDTIGEFENMYQFFKNHGFKEYQITFYCVHPVPFKNYEVFLPSEEELKSFYKKHNWPIFPKKSPSIFLCGAGKNVLRIDAIGNVHLCPVLEFPIGNLREKSLEEIWKNNFVLTIFRKIDSKNFSECLNCDYHLFCETCMAHNWNETKNIFKPGKFICKLAKIFKEVWEENYGKIGNS